jgi:hypothetical protein
LVLLSLGFTMVNSKNTQHNTNLPVYSTTITAGSLMIRESIKVASLMLTGLGKQEIKKKVIEENLFQFRSQGASKIRCGLILQRLGLLNPEILSMITGSDYTLAVQCLLACALKHSRLIGDFMIQVIGSRIRIINDTLSYRDWEKFLETCEQVEPRVGAFTELTRKKLRQIVFKILIESRYLEGQKTRRLTPVRIEPELKAFLIRNKERYVLKCLEVYE